jgi:hypothetical protein
MASVIYIYITNLGTLIGKVSIIYVGASCVIIYTSVLYMLVYVHFSTVHFFSI